MSDIILKNGNFAYHSNKPYEIEFSGASDILFPFSGAVVVPKPTLKPSDFSFESTTDWIYNSLRYPYKGEGSEMIFPTLRTFDNKLFKTEGSMLLLVAQDHTLLDDIDFSNLFSSKAFVPTFKENLSIASLPKYILIKFNELINFPQDAPIAKRKGVHLKTIADAQLVAIKNAMSMASFSGSIHTFDYAGHQTEAASSLLNLGVDKPIVNLPPSKKIRVQFVDLHGNIIEKDDQRITDLKCKPVLTNWNVTHKFFTISFTTAARKWEISQKPINAAVSASEKYLHKFHHLGFWPGYGFNFKEITSTKITLDLAKDLSMEIAKAPRFLRICLFHPGKEFQTTSGGNINDKGIFKLIRPGVNAVNNFKLFHPDNKIHVFNNGKAFMSELYKTVTKENPKRVLKELYLINWKANAHLHLNGSMKAYSIAPTDIDTTTMDAQLNFIDTNRIVINFKGYNAAAGSTNKFLLLSNREDAKKSIDAAFWCESVTMPTATEKATEIAAGFIRAESIYATILTGNPSLKQHQLKAYWKNSLGHVNTTVKTLTASVPVIKPIDIPDTWFQLAITDADPPKAILKRKVALGTIETALGLTPGHTVELLIMHLQRGSYQFIPLNPSAGDINSDDIVLKTLDNYMANNTLIGVLVNRTTEENQEFSNTSILTSACLFSYSKASHLAGSIPLHHEEFGGMIRQAIANKVKVRALFWEQFLANVGGADETGHSNNAEMTAIINRTVDSKRGFAVLDRSTRPFGSLHQKATVLVFETEDETSFKRKEMVAYMGGMDLAHGRWDTEHHHSKDPDRNGGAWFDIHLRIQGKAVHDILLNFKQRWGAIDEFIDTNDKDCRPQNPDAGITNDVNKPIKIETDEIKLVKVKGDTFVQINRTIPPFSCHGKINTATKKFVSLAAGEDGPFQSYTKAIENARKFILINDQYFFSVEMALILHNALKKNDGPSCLILVLPKDLGEKEAIDPLLYKSRERAIQALYYGGNYTGAAEGSKCPHYTVNPISTTPHVKDKVVILHPINTDEKGIYVHSKHIIVDDVFMMIGSANINYRSMSYDWEINAACIGKKLFKGGTHNVRAHRIEICRILAGLPKAYVALLQDYYATFRLLKKIESENDHPSTRLHPIKPRSKKLDPVYKKRIPGNVSFNAGVDFVANLDINSPELAFITCNILDADGRDTKGDQLGVLASAAGAGKNKINAYALLSFSFTCETAIKNVINGGGTAFLEIQMSIVKDASTTEGPFQTHRMSLAVGVALDNVLIVGMPTGELTIPISTENKVIIHASIDGAPTAINCNAQKAFNPSVDTILPGSFIRKTLILI